MVLSTPIPSPVLPESTSLTQFASGFSNSYQPHRHNPVLLNSPVSCRKTSDRGFIQVSSSALLSIAYNDCIHHTLSRFR